MKEYPADALEYLRRAEGLMTAVCAVYYEVYLKNHVDAEKNFRLFCENINFMRGDESLHVENKVAPEEYQKAYDKNKSAVKQIVDNLQSRNDTEEAFYKELWQQLQNIALFPTSIEKVAALIQLAEMPQIPYFQMEKIDQMDDAQFQVCTEKILPQLKKAIFAIGYGYPQKTQLAEQLIQLAASIEEPDERTVFVAQVIAFYEARMQKLLSSTASMEKETDKAE